MDLFLTNNPSYHSYPYLTRRTFSSGIIFPPRPLQAALPATFTSIPTVRPSAKASCTCTLLDRLACKNISEAVSDHSTFDRPG